MSQRQCVENYSLLFYQAVPSKLLPSFSDLDKILQPSFPKIQTLEPDFLNTEFSKSSDELLSKSFCAIRQ